MISLIPQIVGPFGPFPIAILINRIRLVVARSNYRDYVQRYLLTVTPSGPRQKSNVSKYVLTVTLFRNVGFAKTVTVTGVTVREYLCI